MREISGHPRLSSVSRRTRSQWDAFYKDRFDEINHTKNPDQNSVRNRKNHDLGTVKNDKSSYSVIIDDSEVSEPDDDDLCEKKGRAKRKTVKPFKRIEEENPVSEDNVMMMSSQAANKSSNPVIIDDSEFSEPDSDSEKEVRTKRKIVNPIKRANAKALIAEELDLINKLFDTRRTEKGMIKEDNPVMMMMMSSQAAAITSSLPLKFKFDDDSCLASHKTDLEKEIDSLFADLEMCLSESENGFTDISISSDECSMSRDRDESPAARCGRGEHETFLDEQIGEVCKYCRAVLLDIRHVLPPFHVETPDRRECMYYYKETDDEPIRNETQFKGGFVSGNLESSIQYSKGTVFDLIPKADKELYQHQLEGFEFLWKNIAGDIETDKLQTLPAKGGRGCIISHAPGTGKTRLTIVFLQTFMKLYPTCRPVIIAPQGMLLTWEQEFKKWDVNIMFHNLNKINSNNTHSRLVELRKWMMGGGILGISYRLFTELAGGKNDTMKKILVELPGLLVLDEGHNPRNEKSRMFRALSKVKTRRRVMLSGTPFQNNCVELCNTLCLVNPIFSKQITSTSGRKRKWIDEWSSLTSFIGKGSNINDDFKLKKLRSMIEPFVHINNGGILEKTLPGKRDFLILLKPTDLQKKLLLQNNAELRPGKFFEQQHLASLISVHPALVSKRPEFSNHKREVERVEFDPNEGVKTRFLVKLIELSSCLGEKVLVFSQYIDPLEHIKSLLAKHFSWHEGREMIYLDGNCVMNERQRLMNSFNDKRSKAKVMLASQRACSEGINLIGASRVVFLDVVWNPSVERQAICRAYRLGQEKVVHVYRLLVSEEVDKYARQAEKERLSELIFSPVDKGVKTRITGCDEDVEEDKVLQAMVESQSLGGIFEKIVHQPKD
ncbi:hypothetical protein CASFOL_026332 [Castilleja foliolosa]|uniref:Uncharacterized protein n=1 Tax=Castilleja foliolosa TaxID=1961234 RepID=A0ABD3CK46_9LAMI